MTYPPIILLAFFLLSGLAFASDHKLHTYTSTPFQYVSVSLQAKKKQSSLFSRLHVDTVFDLILLPELMHPLPADMVANLVLLSFCLVTISEQD